MKPSKNRMYCRDCQRCKMLFQTEKKANTFMKFNSEIIRSITGYCPNRSYYCMACMGWHVTSKRKSLNIKTKTEIVLGWYQHHQEQEVLRKKRFQHEKNRNLRVSTILEIIEKQVNIIEVTNKRENIEDTIKIINSSFANLIIAKSIEGSEKRIESVEDKLKRLKREMEAIINTDSLSAGLSTNNICAMATNTTTALLSHSA